MAYLRGSPAAAGQRQPVGPERAGRVQAGHALLPALALVALAAALAARALPHIARIVIYCNVQTPAKDLTSNSNFARKVRR